jgi:hypothetical protein
LLAVGATVTGFTVTKISTFNVNTGAGMLAGKLQALINIDRAVFPCGSTWADTFVRASEVLACDIFGTRTRDAFIDINSAVFVLVARQAVTGVAAVRVHAGALVLARL